MSISVNVITPSGSQIVTVEENQTVGGLKDQLGLSDGLKASSGGVPIADNALASEHTRISFAGGSKSNSGEAVKLSYLVSTGLLVAEVALSTTHPISFGGSKAKKLRESSNGAIKSVVILPPNLVGEVKDGDLVIIGNSLEAGIVAKVRRMTSQEALLDTQYKVVLGTIDADGLDDSKAVWDKSLEDATNNAEESIEAARRSEAIKQVSQELLGNPDSSLSDAIIEGTERTVERTESTENSTDS